MTKAERKLLAAKLGSLGGKRRAKSLTPERMAEIARQGGLARAAKIASEK